MTALAVAVLGLVMLSVTSQARLFERPLKRDRSQKVEARSGRAFEPLTLGEDPMIWPSERPARPSVLAPLPWPSEAWDDPQFGQFRGGAPALEMPEIGQQKPKAAEKPKAEKKAKKAQKPKQQAPAPQPDPPAAGPQVPSAAEVRSLVQSRGLAGAVQHIRERTGWDFQRAAEYLAQAMKP